MFVKSVCRGPFLVVVYGVFILRRDVLVLLHYVEMQYLLNIILIYIFYIIKSSVRLSNHIYFNVFLLLCLCILNVMYVLFCVFCFHCVVLCIVCV